MRECSIISDHRCKGFKSLDDESFLVERTNYEDKFGVANFLVTDSRLYKRLCPAVRLVWDTRFSFYKNTVYKNISLRFGKKIRTS